MKRIVSFALCLVVSFSVFAQKKELKGIEKLIKSSKLSDAADQLDLVASSVEGTNNEAYFSYLRGQYFFKKKDYGLAMSNFHNAINTELVKGQKKYKGKSIDFLNKIEGGFEKKSSKLIKDENFLAAAKVFEEFSEINPERKDVLESILWCYQKGKNYSKVAEILASLLKQEESVSHNATNKNTKKTNKFFNKEDRDKALVRGTHMFPVDLVLDKKTRIDDYNFLVRVYYELKDVEKQLSTLDFAKKEFPNHKKFYEDYALVLSKKGDKTGYLNALNELLRLSADDKDLWFKIGVVSQELKLTDKAVSAYDKVIELDPTNTGAYVNKGLALLSKEQGFYDELNKNRRNRKKYAQIKKNLKAMYLKAIPSFEKAYELGKDEGVKATLIGLYESVNQKSKAAALK